MKNAVALLSLTVLLSACSGPNQAIDATKQMPGKMDQMLNSMNRTNDAVDLQKEQLPFEAMLNPQYGQNLSPIPFDLMPFAEKFAENTPPEDFIEIVYLWMKKLNESTLDAASPTADQIAAFNQAKLQTLSALQAICGFLPQAEVETIVADQIVAEGRYQQAAEQMLMLRVRFLRDVLLEADLFAEPLDNVGKLEQAMDYASSIDYIARLPYAAQLSINITGFMDPIPAIQESFDPKLALQTWQKIDSKAARSLTVQQDPLTGSAAADQQLFKQRQAQVKADLATVDAKIVSWGAKP